MARENSFGRNLKSMRQAAHISRVKLAQEIHSTDRSIGAYERGENEPNLATLNLLADYFGTTTDVLLGRTDHSSTETEDRVKTQFLNGVWQLHEEYFGK